jgi:hypothetical protein
VVTPSNPRLQPGAVLQFTATVSGTPNTEVEWTSTGGVIGPNGSYTAGAATGTFAVTAKLRGGTLNGATTIYIDPGTSEPAPTVRVLPGQNIQNIVNSVPEGAVIAIAAGIHRLHKITPKANQTFVGEPGAILSGATVLTGWVQDGSRWYVGGQTQEGTVTPATMGGFKVCQTASPRCGYPEDVFMDNTLKKHVATLGEVAAGTWFFDYASDRIYVGDNPGGRLVETSSHSMETPRA